MAANTEQEMKDWIEAFKVRSSHAGQDGGPPSSRKEAPRSQWVHPGCVNKQPMSAHHAPNMCMHNITTMPTLGHTCVGPA